MSSSPFEPKIFDAIVKSVKDAEPDPELAGLNMLDQFVLSFLLWEASETDARRAFNRLRDAFIDFNELRVCYTDEIADVLGARYPRAAERAERLKASLNDVFNREHAVSFEKVAEMQKRQARQYLESLEGITPYVVARQFLVALGGHAVPVDERLLTRLIDEGAFEAGTDVERAIGALERHVKATESAETHVRLMRWADQPASQRGTARKSARRAPKATTTKKKTTNKKKPGSRSSKA